VLWAVEQGITKGTDATHFSPYSTLSTQHMLTFLYRTMNPGEDGWDGEAATWSYDSNRLPFGVNLSVNNTTDCPRGAVVTFLYRCLESGSFIDELTVSAAIEDRTDKSLLILARVEGGVSPYTYKWQVLGFDGNWSTPLYGQTDGWGLWTSTDGTYRCIVTDSKGKSTVSNTIEIGEPSKNILSEDDFLIYVEDSLNISGRGRVITGRVINGSVKVGDSIILRSYDPETGAPTETDYTVLGIEMFKKAVDNAKKGDYAGIWISSDGNAKAEKGDAIVKKGSSLLTLAKSFTGTVVLSDARTTPVTKDNRFQYSYAGCLVTASFEDLNGLDIEPGGSRGGVVLSAEHPVTWYVGQTLSIMAGGQNYGTFTITGIK
ncbi:MAG: hypothetical protein IJG63_04095, partial [Oscillospiraceae bacterium]|nr:hypothetical protein [Oscillospiraceae bacterium]